jgi:hypothetical protein
VPLPPNPVAHLFGGPKSPAPPPTPSPGATPHAVVAAKVALPPNPLASTVFASGGPKAAPKVVPVATKNPAPAPIAPHENLVILAQHIATVPHLTPEFIAHLQTLNHLDPTFNTRLAAAVKIAEAQVNAKNDASLEGIIGQTVESTANPLEWLAQGVHGVGELQKGHIASGALDVAGLLPFAKAPRAVLEGVRAADEAAHAAEAADEAARAAKAGRNAEEAAKHLATARSAALAEGYGNKTILHPKLAPGEVTPATAGKVGAEVRAALSGKTSDLGAYERAGIEAEGPIHSAASARKVQLEGYSPVRAARAGAYKDAYEAAVAAGHSPTAADAIASQKLAGELPVVHWNNRLVHLDSKTMDEMVSFIHNHPALKPFQAKRAIEAIGKITAGRVPQLNEQRLLESIFGKETSGSLVSLAKSGDWKKLAVDVLNVPRAVMASTDLSAPMRQGLVAGVTHPIMFAKSFGPMIKAAHSEDFFQHDIQDVIHNDPDFPLAHKAGIAFTDIGDAQHGAASLGMREEARMSNLAERIPFGVGKVIRASDRAYVGFLNKLRMDYFKRLLNEGARLGQDWTDEKSLQAIGHIINDATGRGTVPAVLQDHLATANALFFAPRLLASRFNVLFNPLKFRTLTPFARREALRQLASLGGFAITVGTLAKMAGASVNLDPRNADFAKIKLGNTRIDFLGGFQQIVRLGAQIETGQIVSSTTGKLLPLGHGFGQKSRLSVIIQFLRGKLSPVPSLVVDALAGQDFVGNPVTWNSLGSYERELGSRMVPFLAQDIWDLYHTSGTAGLLAAPLDLFGMGVQSYKAKTPKSGGGGGGYGGYGDSGPLSGDLGGGLADNSLGGGLP